MPDPTNPAQEANPPAQEAGATADANPAAAASPVTLTSGQTPPPAEANDVASLPVWAQQEIAALRRENAQRRTAERDAARQAQEAEEQRLQQAQEWQTLAEQRAARIAALEPAAADYEALSAEITAALEDEIATWPDEIRVLRPAAEAGAAALMAWTRKARHLAQKLQQPQPAQPGQAPAPKPAGTSSADQRQRTEQALERARSTF